MLDNVKDTLQRLSIIKNKTNTKFTHIYNNSLWLG